MKRVAFARADGGVSLVDLKPRKGETEDAFIARMTKILAEHGEIVVEHKIVDAMAVPSDRSFRNAWGIADPDDPDCYVYVPGGIAIRMGKAREIHMARIRRERDLKLEVSDGLVVMAMERGDTAALARLTELRQKLRDLPQTLDLSKAKTPEQLKAIWPAELDL